jgi:uncharacterized protein YlxW (UPF0749 family)
MTDEPSPDPESEKPERTEQARRRISAAGAVIGLLVGLLAFGLVVQIKSNTTGDTALANARQDDLVSILSDLNARELRLRSDVTTLQGTLSQLGAGAQGRDAALAEARRRADELGILAGTLAATGPGLVIGFERGAQPVHASTVLGAIEELRGAGAEAMQISGTTGGPVRIVASTSFIDVAKGGISVDGTVLSGSFTVTVIGPAQTMRTALTIPGGVSDAVARDGGTVTVDEPASVTVDALHPPADLRYAKPSN